MGVNSVAGFGVLFVTMTDETQNLAPVDWRDFFRFDVKATVVLLGCALFLVGLLAVLPAWLRAQERADFAGTVAQTAPGIVTICQISPVSQGGGGLFNAVTVEFGKRQAYYALPPQSKWLPRFHQDVRVTYRVGRRTGAVRVDSVTPL